MEEGYGATWTICPSEAGGPGKKGRNAHIIILELKTVVMACQRFEESLRGNTISFQIDNTTACLSVERMRNSLQDPRWYYKGSCSSATRVEVMCAWNATNALPRGKKAQPWSLGGAASHRLLKQWGTQIVDLFASSGHTGYLYISVWISHTGEHLGEISWKRGGWMASSMPSLLQTSSSWSWAE